MNIPLSMKLDGTKQNVFQWYAPGRNHIKCATWWLTSRTLPVPCSCFMAEWRSLSATWGNSSTPLWMRKHLKPATPALIMGWSSSCKKMFSFFKSLLRSEKQPRQNSVHVRPRCLTIPDFQGSRPPRKLCPQNTSLLLLSASYGNFQVLWLEGRCFCRNSNQNAFVMMLAHAATLLLVCSAVIMWIIVILRSLWTSYLSFFMDLRLLMVKGTIISQWSCFFKYLSAFIT